MGITRQSVQNIYEALSAELKDFDHSSESKAGALLYGHYECPFEWGTKYPEHIESIAHGMKALIAALGVFDQTPQPSEHDALSVTLEAVLHRINALSPRDLTRLQGDNAQAVLFSHAQHAVDTMVEKRQADSAQEDSLEAEIALKRLPSINHSWWQ